MESRTTVTGLGMAQRVAERLIGHARRWLMLMLASGWLVGVSLWPLAHWESRDFLIKNDLSIAQRYEVLRYGSVGVLAVALLYVLVWLWWRRTDGELSAAAAFTRLSGRWYITLCTPLVVALLVSGVEADHGMLSMLFISVVTVVTMIWAHGLQAPPDDPQEPPTPPRWFRDPAFGAVLILVVMYGAAMTYLSLLEHRNIETHAYDLGIYDNLMWRTVHGDWLGCSLCKGGNHASGHFDPILIALSPIYKLWPRAQTLLVVQTWWIASAGIPLYLIGRRALARDRRLAVVLVAVFFLHPALHGVNLFDFHSLALCIPLVLWVVYCIDIGSRAGFVVAFVLLLLVREDMALLSCFIGLYAFIRGRPLWGILTVVAAISYLAVVKTSIMPDAGLLQQASKDASSHIYYYDDMIPHSEEGMRGLVVSAFSNPAFAAKMVFLNEGKLFYAFALFTPVLWLPLFGAGKRVLMLYGLAFVGFVSREHVYSLHFQYSAVVLPFVLAATPAGVVRCSKWRVTQALVPSNSHFRRTVTWGILVASLLVSARFGAFVPNRSFEAGWNHLVQWSTPEQVQRYAAVRTMVARIPDSASVAASSALVPHVSNRKDVFKYPSLGYADYLLLNMRSLENKKKDKPRVRAIRRKYVKLAEYDGIELLKRTAKKPGRKKSKTSRSGARADPKPALNRDGGPNGATGSVRFERNSASDREEPSHDLGAQ